MMISLSQITVSQTQVLNPQSLMNMKTVVVAQEVEEEEEGEDGEEGQEEELETEMKMKMMAKEVMVNPDQHKECRYLIFWKRSSLELTMFQKKRRNNRVEIIKIHKMLTVAKERMITDRTTRIERTGVSNKMISPKAEKMAREEVDEKFAIKEVIKDKTGEDLRIVGGVVMTSRD